MINIGISQLTQNFNKKLIYFLKGVSSISNGMAHSLVLDQRLARWHGKSAQLLIGLIKSENYECFEILLVRRGNAR